MITQIRDENQKLGIELQNCNQSKQAQISSLNATIAEKDNTIRGLNQRIVSFNDENLQLKS